MFAAVHVAAVAGVAHYGISVAGILLVLVMYAVRMFALTAGVHRYFAHRAFKTTRTFQLVLAVVATTSCQLGLLWWVSQHRYHHRHADEPSDPHAPSKGLWWSHAGWFLSHAYDDTRWNQVRDFEAYPELRWLDRHYFVPVIVLVGLLLAVGGVPAVVWGFGVSTVLLWHATFSLTSFGHRHGHRRYETHDESRNNAAIALVTFGDGWHNNHHYYPGSARHGFFWWELDLSYYALRVFEALGIVWDLRVVPDEVRERSLAVET